MKTPYEIKESMQYGINESFAIYDDESYCPGEVEVGFISVEDLEAALAYIQQLEAELDNTRLSFAQQTREVEEYKVELLNQVKKTIEQLPKWISVEERLPKEFATVLMMRDDIKQACVGWLIGGCWSVPKGVRVTHWMPLPKPPEV